MLKSIDTERGLYVIASGTGKNAGYSCLGFDYAYSRAMGVFEWARRFDTSCPVPLESFKGTDKGYAQYLEIMTIGANVSSKTGKRCEIELTPQLRGLEGKRVEIVDQDGETRRFYVGESTGWMPCHLEIEKRNDSGGMAVYGAPFQSVRIIGTR